jgi:hypothetical protein
MEEKIKVHPSGEKYYSIAMSAVDDADNKMELRLFESMSNARLKFKEGEDETFDEYKIRRKYMKQSIALRKANKIIWNSSQWGTMTPEKAIEVQKIIQEQIESIKQQENGKGI